MSDAMMPPRAAWPSFPWKDSGWWLAVAAMVATLAFFVAPELMALDTRVNKLLVSGLLLASPVPIIALRYAGAVFVMLARRIYHYPRLYRMLEQRIDTSQTLERHLADSIEAWTRYEIARVHWFRDRGEMYLLIRKKGGKPPNRGATFWAYDTDYGRPMAVSEMIENRGDGYYARVTDFVDPLWLGDVRKQNVPELPPPPGVSAFLGPKREGSRSDGDNE